MDDRDPYWVQGKHPYSALVKSRQPRRRVLPASMTAVFAIGAASVLMSAPFTSASGLGIVLGPPYTGATVATSRSTFLSGYNQSNSCTRSAHVLGAPHFNSTSGQFGMKLFAEAGKSCSTKFGVAQASGGFNLTTSKFTVPKSGPHILRAYFKVQWRVNLTTVNSSWHPYAPSADAATTWGVSVTLIDLTIGSVWSVSYSNSSSLGQVNASLNQTSHVRFSLPILAPFTHGDSYEVLIQFTASAAAEVGGHLDSAVAILTIGTYPGASALYKLTVQ